MGRNSMGTKEQFDNGLTFIGREIGIRYSSQSELADLMSEVIRKGIDAYREMICDAQETVFNLYTIERCYDSLLNFFYKIENENK
jgi:hypothetical protein